MKNTSQDPEYEGRPYHEKKFHKTHFGVIRTLRKSKSKTVWVKIAPGRYKLARKDKNEQFDEQI